MCLTQGHNTVTPMGIEPRTSRFGVRRSTTTPSRSPQFLESVFYLYDSKSNSNTGNVGQVFEKLVFQKSHTSLEIKFCCFFIPCQDDFTHTEIIG